jgi:PKD repeat protein
VKKNKYDMSVRELFRQKLGKEEVIPDPSVGLKIMKAQARKEFLRLNPARFNIYYAGVILVAVITSVLVLFNDKSNTESIPPINVPSEITLPVTKETPKNIVNSSEIQKSDTTSRPVIKLVRKTPVATSKPLTKKVPVQKSDLSENHSISFTGVNDSLTKKVLSTGFLTEKNKLKAGLKGEELLFQVSAAEGCAPLNLTFRSLRGSSDSCRWTFGDGGYSNEKNPKWIFDVEGEYKVVLNVFGIDGSKETTFKLITVYPKPKARFEINPENAVLPKDEIRFFNYSADAVHFNWDFGDGTSSELFEPNHKYLKSGNYNVRLIATSDYGCSDSLTVINAYSGSEYFINFPNAFIPNSQGPSGGFYSAKSDEAALIFHPVSSGVSDYQIKVFSRLGIVVFETNDINIGWDGYFKGQLAEPGVYIWKARGTFRNGEPFVKTGDITLLK